MAEPRHLIVNADDLGLAESVNEGIYAAHEGGIVTSASLMACRSTAPAAAELLARHSGLAVGLHLDFSGRDFATGVASPTSSFFLSSPVGEKGRTPAGEAAARGECRRQLEIFRDLVGRDPTHLDSHHHVHEAEPVRTAAEALAAELGVPLRNRAIRYEGGFFGRCRDGEPLPEAIAPARLIELIRALPPGWTEIGCHPAAGPVPGSSYDAERQVELRTLCDPEVRSAIEESAVELRSFAQVTF